MAKKIKVGDNAPKVTIPNQDQENVKLSDFIGQWVVLYFYPKDNTPGCTIQATDFTKMKKKFENLDATIIGVSKDSCSSHTRFIEKQKLKIMLLSDEGLELHKAFDVWRPKKFMGKEFLGTIRSTFLINPKGKIEKIWDNVKAKGHAEEVLQTLKDLQ